MPFFESDEVNALVGETGAVDRVLDLRGASLETAQTAIDELLKEPLQKKTVGVVVRIDPATASSGETLFLPVGRHLLDARKRGQLNRCQPISVEDGAGFYVELPASD
ncbi:MAG: hypothetical protein AAF648_15190 [Pseudomonadota bacterium]